MNRPNILIVDHWENHERRILALLKRALILLNEQDLSLLKDELALNKELSHCFQRALRELREAGEPEPSRPKLNLIKQGDMQDDGAVYGEGTIPDFTVDCIDHAQGSEFPDRPYNIECKRLGSFAGKRNLCKEYVTEGVQRFVCESHQYGRNAPAGAMVGYVQGSDVGAMVSTINGHNEKCGMAVCQLVCSEGTGAMVELSQELHRPFPITPFRLNHCWADLRHHYQAVG